MHLHVEQSALQMVRSFIEEATSLQLNPVSETGVEKGRRVGAGSFSIVSEAYLVEAEKKRRRVVALKELRPDQQKFDVQRRQLLDEASVLARLNHKNILRYIGCGVSASSAKPRLFMLQEFLVGGSLDERLRMKRIAYEPRFSYSLGTALRWALQVTCAIGYLHSTEIGIVHRDIKLANLLLTDRNIEQADVKLADFGLSVDMKRVKAVNKRHARIASWKYQTLSTQTRKNLSPWLQSAGMQRKMTDPMPTKTKTTVTTATTMNCTSWIKRQMSSKRDRRSADETDDLLYYNLTEETGSYMYMSPEVWLGLPYNEKVDIYSLGVLIAELLTGRPLSSCLLPEKSYEEAKIFSYCVANGLQLRCPRHFPKPLAAILDSCWNPDPVQRPTAGEIWKVLSAFEASCKNAHKLPLFHPMSLTPMQKFKLSFARMKYLHSD